MISHLKKLGKHTAIFSFAGILSKGVGFMLLPLYTRYLSPVDYGILELLALMLSLSILMSVQGMPSAFFQRYTYKYKDDEEQKEKALSTAFFYLTISVGCYCSIFYVFAEYINNIFFESDNHSDLLRIIAVTVFIQCITYIPNALLRAKLKSMHISVVQLLQLLVNISCNVYFVVALGLGVKGIMYGNLIAAIINALMMFALTAKAISLSFSFKILKDMLSFGLPLVPAGMALFVMNGSDRFFLQKFSTTHQLGLYALGYKISTILQFVVIEPFLLVWPSVFFPLAKEPDAQITFGRLISIFYFLMSFAGLVFILLAKPIILVMAAEEFWDAHTVCVWIISSVILYGMYNILNIGINIKERTTLTPVIVGVAALLNLVLNYLLIPKYGMTGAAISTFLSFFVMAAFACYINNIVYPVTYQWGFLIKVSIFFCASVLLAQSIEVSSLVFHIVRVLIVLLFFIGGILVSSMLTKYERANTMALIRSARPIIDGIIVRVKGNCKGNK